MKKKSTDYVVQYLEDVLLKKRVLFQSFSTDIPHYLNPILPPHWRIQGRGGTAPLNFRPNWGPKGRKKIWRPAPLPSYLPRGLDDRAPLLSQGMDPALLLTRNTPTNPKNFPSITTILRLVAFLWEVLSPPWLWQTGRLSRCSAAIAQIRCDSSRHAEWTSVRMIVRNRCFKIFDNCEITITLRRTRVTTR